VRASLGCLGDGGMSWGMSQVPPFLLLPVVAGLAAMLAPVSWCS
jgi:hypothetical protein